MRKIKMCLLSELPPGQAVEKRILARRVAVFNDNGTIYGLEADCKHMKAPLVRGGVVADGIITCKWHNWKYDMATGKCLTIDKVKLKKYDVEIADETVYLKLDF